MSYCTARRLALLLQIAALEATRDRLRRAGLPYSLTTAALLAAQSALVTGGDCGD